MASSETNKFPGALKGGWEQFSLIMHHAYGIGRHYTYRESVSDHFPSLSVDLGLKKSTTSGKQ